MKPNFQVTIIKGYNTTFSPFKVVPQTHPTYFGKRTGYNKQHTNGFWENKALVAAACSAYSN